MTVAPPRHRRPGALDDGDRSSITVGNNRRRSDDQRARVRHHLARSATSSPSPARRPTPQDGTLPASALSLGARPDPPLPVELPHAPDPDVPGVASGSFTAPDHEYPSHLELRLTATDSGGLQRHDERAAATRRRSTSPSRRTRPGSQLVVERGRRRSAVHPHRDRRLDELGERRLAAAARRQRLHVPPWSDRGAATHSVTAGAAPATFTATYDVSISGPVAAYGFEEPSGATIVDNSTTGTTAR